MEEKSKFLHTLVNSTVLAFLGAVIYTGILGKLYVTVIVAIIGLLGMIWVNFQERINSIAMKEGHHQILIEVSNDISDEKMEMMVEGIDEVMQLFAENSRK